MFMGSEIAPGHEWRDREELDWDLLQWPVAPRACSACCAISTASIATLPALHEQDFEGQGLLLDRLPRRRPVGDQLAALGATAASSSSPSTSRQSRATATASACPTPGLYAEVLNSDSAYYGGSNTGNGSGIAAVPLPWMGRPASIEITLPPLAGVILRLR